MVRPPLGLRIRESIKFFRRGLTVLVPEKKKMPFLWPTWREGKPQWHIVDYESYANEGFSTNALIYSAVMFKYRALRSAPLRAYTGTPEAAQLANQEGPLAQLIARPNPFMGQSAFMGLCDIYLNLAGYAPVMLDREKTGELPKALYPLRPDRVWIIPDSGKKGIKGYYYVPEGKGFDSGVPILAEDMMFPKLPNPMDPLEGMGYGLSPLSAIAQSADVDNQITHYLKLVFERGAQTQGLLKFNVALDDIDVDRVRRRWMEIYGGYENWTDIGVLDSGGDYQRTSMNFQELGFEVLDERNEGRILGPFGVPPSLLGTRMSMKTSTYNNRQTDRQIFWEDTMQPELDVFEDEFRYFLRDGQEFPAFDLSEVPALRKDLDKQTLSFNNLVNAGIPKYVAARIVGLDIGELSDGNVIYMPLGLVPMGTAEPAGEGGTTPSASTDPRKQFPLPFRKALPARGMTEAQKNGHYKRIDTIAQAHERQFRNAAAAELKSEEREVLALVDGTKKASIKKKRASTTRG